MFLQNSSLSRIKKVIFKCRSGIVFFRRGKISWEFLLRRRVEDGVTPGIRVLRFLEVLSS